MHEQMKLCYSVSNGALPRGDGIGILRSPLPVGDTLGHCPLGSSTTPDIRYTSISGEHMDTL